MGLQVTLEYYGFVFHRTVSAGGLILEWANEVIVGSYDVLMNLTNKKLRLTEHDLRLSYHYKNTACYLPSP